MMPSHFVRPEDAKPGDSLPAALVSGWPTMSDQSVIAFRKWTGHKQRDDNRLVRDAAGGRIFEVGASRVAKCVWMTDRKF